MINIFDFIKSINNKKYIFNEENASEYNVYMVNKAFSYFPETVFYALECDKLQLEGKQHYDFLFYTIPKGNRFSKWSKTNVDKDIELISDHFEISLKKAKTIKRLVDIEEIKELWKGT